MVRFLNMNYCYCVALTFSVSSITWLENLVFLMVHTPSQFDSGQAPNSTFHLVTKQSSNYTFQKISDPAGPFGLNRSPPHHFMLRLRDFPPNLQDLIIVASSASADIGLFSRSKVPLTSDKPADSVTGVFTMTEMSDDSRRAALPMSANFSDTSPIGLAMDFSSNQKVEKPIAGDEMDESPFPVPALMVLNNEGVLAAWWVIYMDSIRQGTAYPGLVVVGGSQTAQPATAPAVAPAPAFGTPSQPTFGSSAFGTANTSSAFGTARPTTSFGTPSSSGPSTGAFGAPSGLGKSQSPWGASPSSSTASNAPAFGSSTFGSATAASNPAFGTPSFGATSKPSLGNRASPWGSAVATGTTATFGQAGGLGKPASVFGSSINAGSTLATPSGFASFASNKGGFAAAAAKPAGTPSVFGSQLTPTPNPFSSSATSQPAGTTSIFGSQPASNPNPFSTPATGQTWGASSEASGANPLASGGFKLSTSFKAGPSAKDEPPETSAAPQGSFFGGNFGSALGEATKPLAAETPVSKETDMDSDDMSNKAQVSNISSTTPASTPAAPKPSIFGSAPPATGGLFGNSPATSNLSSKSASAGFGVGKPSDDKPKPAAFSFANVAVNKSPGPKTPLPSEPQPSPTIPKTPLSPKIKQEAVTYTPNDINKIREAPLPPDTTSKVSFAAGESSGSSVGADAPLPPDFMTKSPPKPTQPISSPAPLPNVAKPIPAELIPPSDVPGGPDDDGDDSGFLTEEGDDESDNGSDDVSEELSEEGSGEDVAKDLSPTSENNQTPAISPESSFGGLKNGSLESSVFTKISKAGQPRPALFGELNGSAPVLLPPKVQLSPRSPSPVRNSIPGRLRPETSRSSSAPGFASQLLGSQRGGRTTIPAQPTLAQTEADLLNEERRRQEVRARKEAEEKQALVDEEDDRFHAFMKSELEPLRNLPDFEVHADYQGQSSLDSIPAQVEAVYRDINSMIDCLGVNARAMECFIKFHTEQYKDEGRTREDLERDDDWCLVEIDNLSSVVERDLAQDLANGRVKDVDSKLQSCDTLLRELIKLRAKHEDLKKMIDARQDPTSLAIARAQPLSAEQAAQQTDLRKDFIKFQKLLSETEEALTILKATMVSHEASKNRGSGSGGPTVEAVLRTIKKMTTMAEKRSGDVVLLEEQMRKLRFNSVDSREGSPFATPKNNRASLRNPAASSTFGLFYTPDSIKETPQRFQNSLMSSVGSLGRSSPPRKKMSGYSIQEKTQLRAQLAKKQAVTERLKTALKKNGTKVRPMVDDD
ncbi:hypothetical protein ONS96_011948 [Cadophora gregata f. sp. sojae]|nr:hypothetical protein ONS96_011948 [Cadophora gregata f. sp. sojae]